MDSLTILIILLVIVVIIALVYYLLHFGHIDFLNARLDEITGQDATIPQTVRKALEPLTFKTSDIKPSGYSHYYEIPPSSIRRVVLVTCTRGFCAALDGEQLTDVLNETRYKQTVSGLLFPSEQATVLEVYVSDEAKPVIHLSQSSHNSPSPARSEQSPSIQWQ